MKLQCTFIIYMYVARTVMVTTTSLQVCSLAALKTKDLL